MYLQFLSTMKTNIYILLYVMYVHILVCMLTYSTLSYCSYPPAWPTDDIPTIRETAASLIKYVGLSRGINHFRSAPGDLIEGYVLHTSHMKNATVAVYLHINICYFPFYVFSSINVMSFIWCLKELQFSLILCTIQRR